ncbi:MAG: GntR family transcriptional regulator [Bosea sp.]|uniref:FCD domain-containing protein n=1 Tax=Bosea sp. (in: a-proteobacteria) TaxID=1871050 RepID=UPI0010F5DD0C|nr:GntR family transcriptional regulator [Bosea sp. (in: a-proteobacteria)]MCP4734838.1 GntR family transcriptional regulator [Bosea sp. (in: a-proteobacteria)]
MATDGAGFDASEDLSRAEYVYSRLMTMLRTGELRAGQRLREVELAEQLGVSRTPIREALRRISSEGLIEILPGRGMIVAAYDKQQVRELYALRGVLEGAAAQLAARYASLAELDFMRELLERSIALFAAPNETMRLNGQFHRAIHEAARNRYLQAALAKMSDSLALLPGTTFAEPGRAATAHAEHLAILDAITHQRADEAELLARRHIEMAGAARLRMMFAGG